MTAYEFVKNKVKIAVFDTPGLADATGNDEEYLRKIQAKEKKFDLFLFCTELNTVRFRNDDLETIKKLTSTLGPQLWNQAIVVFTFANEVRRSPSKKAKDKSEKDVFTDRFRGFKRKIQEALLDIGVPQEAVMNVPFVPAGDLDEPRLPDRNNWLTAFWIAAFKRITRDVKPAFLAANADRFAFSRVLADDEEKLVRSGLVISGLTTGEVQVIKAVKQKLQETSFAKKLEGCFLKPRVCDEDGTTSATSIKIDECSSEEVIPKKSACSIEMDECSSEEVIPKKSACSIEMDECSSQDVITKKKSACSIEIDESSFQDAIGRSAPSIEMDVSSSQDAIGRSAPSIEMDVSSSQDAIGRSAPSIEIDVSSSQDAIGRSAPSIEMDECSFQDVITKKKSACSIEIDVSSSQDAIGRSAPSIEMDVSSSQDVNTKKSAPSIEMDESSSQDVLTAIVGDITKNLMGDRIGSTFGRFYQTFFRFVIRNLKRMLRSHSLEKPLKDAIKEKGEDCGE